MHAANPDTSRSDFRRLGRSAALFAAIGLALYAGIYYASERLTYRTGHSNPLFKVATAAHRSYDWVILGASHAMPLDFAEVNATMERETGKHILNLASPGTGPLYNRFVLEHVLRERRADGVLYVLDSFAFYSRTWNEDRFADAKLLSRTPFHPAIARRLARYSLEDGVSPLAVLDYAAGFSKINNRERFERDVWEGERQFDRLQRPSAAADRNRIAYLYPEAAPRPAVLARYLEEFSELIALARRETGRVTVIKMPVPARFYDQLPNEAAFDLELRRLLVAEQVEFHDFSRALDEPRFYFDTDHLNREGLTVFFSRHLKAILSRVEDGAG